MVRKTGLQPLTLSEPSKGRGDATNSEEHNTVESPLTPLSAKSPRSPRSPFRFNTKKSQSQSQSQSSPTAQQQQDLRERDEPSARTTDPQTSTFVRDLPTSQTLPSLSAIHSSRDPDKFGVRERPSRTGFFANYKASKSSNKPQVADSARQVIAVEEDMSRDTDRPAMNVKVSSQDTKRSESGSDRSVARKPVGGPSRPDASLASTNDSSPQSQSNNNNNNTARKNKPKPFSLLGRTRSLRDDHSPSEPSPPKNNNYLEPEPRAQSQKDSSRSATSRGEKDGAYKEMTPSNHPRQRSQDRQPSGSRENGKESSRDNGRNQSSFSTTFKEAGGHAFFNNLKSTATKGAGALHKNLFGKAGRSGSTTDKEPLVDDEHYQLRVINLPLVEQTRLTRISKRLEDSRDKTEFWMPSFPWRAIDYLNYKGSDVEGLYRIPGSGPQIKKWQRRFDEELDIDLFEQDDLYDINIIGSMLKAWLRELPDELLPKAAQDRIARECAGSESVPQQLIDELSNLSPFNYYLLFAITCHLSLLLAHSEKNKMDFRNLCICFQPCMKMDAFCFKFLVCDWRDCWKGCKTEAAYIEQEYMIFDGLPPGSAGGRSSTAVESHDERNVSSSDSSKPSSVSIDNHGRKHSNEKGRKGSQEKKSRKSPERAQSEPRKEPVKEPSISHNNTMSRLDAVSTTTLTVQALTPPRRSDDMRPLSPIKPLSPIGF